MVTATGNVTANNGMFTNIVNVASHTGTTVSVSGNITGGNIIGTIVGTIATTSASLSGNITANNGMFTNIVNVASHTGTLVSVSGNITAAGGTFGSGNISTTGNIAANYFVGNGSALTGISAAGGTANLIANGTSQINIPSSGGNANITIGATSNIAVFATTGVYVTGLVSASGNLNTGVGVSAVGNLTGAGITTTGSAGSISGTGNVTAAGFTASGNISATGNIQAGNILATTRANAASFTGGLVSVTGTITGASVAGGVITGTSVSVTGNVTANNGMFTNVVNVASHTGTIVSVTGTVTAGNLTTAGILTVNSGNAITAIVNGTGNGQGNIGNSTGYFNRLFAQATTALYADLAEMYVSDAVYPPGTVLVFGGNQEVTVSTADSSRRVAGVISTNPAHVMNSGLQGEHTVELALTGRVPTLVSGPVAKGDMMVSTADGRARAEENPVLGTVIGKALEDFYGTDGTIEIVVGRL